MTYKTSYDTTMTLLLHVFFFLKCWNPAVSVTSTRGSSSHSGPMSKEVFSLKNLLKEPPVNAHFDPRWILSSSGPAAVSNLLVISANTSSLSFSWRPSDGHVDIYDLTLYSISEGTTNHRQGSPGSRRDHHTVGSTFTCFLMFMLS